jgi:transketolase
MIGNGTDVSIITYGFLFKQALGVKEELESRGLSVRILNLRTVRPIDQEAILEACSKCD